MNAMKTAKQMAASILVAMTITGCDNPQQSVVERQWEDEVKSAKTDDELYEIVKKYSIEYERSLNHITDLWRANRFISAKKMESEVLDNAGKLAETTQRFLLLYPQSKHFAEVESIQGMLLKVGRDAEEIEQHAIETIQATERIHRQRER